MAESKKAMEQRHAKTLGKIAEEEAKEANEYAKGGSVFRSAADGVAKRGKTQADQVKMACGGKVKSKKYAEGGVTEGENANIDDDTRSRALAFAARGGDSDTDTSSTTPAPARRSFGSKTPSAAKPASKDISDATLGQLGADNSVIKRASLSGAKRMSTARKDMADAEAGQAKATRSKMPRFNINAAKEAARTGKKGDDLQTSFAKGGAVKGWGIAKHTNKCKMV